MEQRNLILAIVFSVVVLLGFEMLYHAPLREAEQERMAEQEAAEEVDTTPRPEALDRPEAPSDGVPDAAPGLVGAPDREAILEEAPRVEVDTPKLKGSISLQGGRVDDIVLRDYHEEMESGSPNITLLSPRESAQSYYADFGWVGTGGDMSLPASDTVWEADRETLRPGQDVTLSWTNDEGLTFERVYAVDEDYMFTVTQRVHNETAEALSLAPYGLISRRETPTTFGFWILHEGPLGVFNDTLEEKSYSDLRDDGPITHSGTGGWIGMTDKYWLVTLVPEQDRQVQSRFVHAMDRGVDRYQTDVLYDAQRVQPGDTVESTTRLFAGAKEVSVLDHYRDTYGIANFDRAVDFGWFYFMTKPLFQVLDYFAKLTGNFGVAILILVVIIKIIFFPLANKSFKSMAKMRKLQPEMLKLRERFADDKQRLNQEMMALYKNEKVNPASGCLPILIQIPVFFALYKVLFVTIEMRHAPFALWIQDLSAQDPTSIMNGFGLFPWGVPELGLLNVLNIGILPIIMGFTMYVQHSLNPQPPDPIQARIFKMLPIIFTFLLAQFPAGLVLYWTWNNLLTVCQQYFIMRRHGMQIGGKMEQPLGGNWFKSLQKDSGEGGGTGGTGATEDKPGNGGTAPESGEEAPAKAQQAANGEDDSQPLHDAEPEAEPAGAGATPPAEPQSGQRRGGNPAVKGGGKGRGKSKKARKR